MITKFFLLYLCHNIGFFLGQFSVTLRPEGQATVKYGEALQLTCFSNQVGGIIQIYYIKDNQPVVMVDAVPGFNNCVNHDINESTLSCDFETSEYVLVLNSPVHNRTIFCNQTWNRLTVSARTTVFVQGILTHICIACNIKHLMIVLTFIATVKLKVNILFLRQYNLCIFC